MSFLPNAMSRDSQDKAKAQADQIATLETEIVRLREEAEGRTQEHERQMESVRAELVKANAQRQDEERLAKVTYSF